MSDDSNSQYKKMSNIETDDEDAVVKYHPNDDNPCYTGNSISDILSEHNHNNLTGEHYLEPADYWYHEIASVDNWRFADWELTKPRIGCLYCQREITLYSGCYLFCQTRAEYDRNVSLVACSDACPVALMQICKSTCRTCHRQYIHNRYDNDICRLCSKK